MSDESKLYEYIKRFDERFGLEASPDPKYRKIDIDEKELDRMSEQFLPLLAQSDAHPDYEPWNFFLTYGCYLCAIHMKNGFSLLSRQRGYMDTTVFTHNFDKQLNIEDEESEPSHARSTGNLISWIIDPKSNVDIFDEFLSDFLVHALRKAGQRAPLQSKPLRIRAILPPVSKEFDLPQWKEYFTLPAWEEFLCDYGIKELEIQICDYGELVSVEEGERKYLFLEQTDGVRAYVFLSAYALERGHRVCQGTLAFDANQEDRVYELRNLPEISVPFRRTAASASRETQREFHRTDRAEIKCVPILPVSKGCVSFLGENASDFMYKSYCVIGSHGKSAEIDRIINLFGVGQSLQVADVCARVLDKWNLSDIALSDMIYVANILQRNPDVFYPAALKTAREGRLTPYNRPVISPRERERVPYLPSNYGNFTWRVCNRKIKCVPYSTLDPKRHSEEQMLLSIVDHFDDCTTDLVAEELLYLYKHKQDNYSSAMEPNAYFTAKVFIKLCNAENLMIDSRNEIVRKPNE